MVASWRPDIAVQVAFNANPNDPSTVPVWSNLSNVSGYYGFTGANAVKRGRQYELDQNQAAQPDLYWLDPSEDLNPANTSSPFYPNVVPLRQVLWQATWPNPAAGNLLNANQPASSILGVTSAGYDPSFDSYTVGASVGWITAVGGTTPLVSNTTPQQGANDLTWAVTSTATQQGAGWKVPAVPGTQYTDSVYVRQTTASTMAVAVGGLTEAVDAFYRTTASGWGTADVGGAWTTSGGSAADYSVAPGAAVHASNSVNVVRATLVGATNADTDTVVYVATSVIATGGSQRFAIVSRWTSTSNYYFAALDLGTDQSITLSIIKRVAGVETTLTSTTMPFTYTAGAYFGLRLTVQGTNLSASCWQQYTTEPTTYTLTTTDTALTAAGQVGCYSKLAAGNTNSLPVNSSWQDFSSYCTVLGTTTATTGAYVRLSVTYTATQPTHTIYAITSGTAVAGTVRIDAVQHEAAASAGTFTTTGSTIYGVFRGFIERWPSTWDFAGYMGRCLSIGVDAFEALNLYTLSTAYYQQVLALDPAYYWPLNDAANTSSYGEQSGNNGPPLANIVTKFGAGTLPASGAATEIFGDPGGTGVMFTGASPSTSFTAPGTYIGTGPVSGTTPVTLPPVIGTTWALTFSCWANVENLTSSPVFPTIMDSFVENASTLTHWSPLFLYVSLTGNLGAQYLAEIPAIHVVSAQSTATYFDGLIHHIVGTVTQVSGGNTVVKLYVDGVLSATGTATTASVGGMISLPGLNLQAGGFYTGIASTTFGGTLAHLAIWNREISASEVTALWTAGGLGNAGELSGTRIARFVAAAWAGMTNIDSGLSQMGISTVTSGQAVLSACQSVATTEQGNFWVDKDGQVSFSGREIRYLELTSRWTFGENTSAGEYPYAGDIEFDLDPTYVYNTVTVNNADGVTATVTSAASQQQYFPRSVAIDVDAYTDDAAIQLAYWINNTHQQPAQRVAAITLNPAGYPTLWPVILSMEINDRVTVKRRASAANNNTGLTMSADFFIESISHDQIDMEAGTWQTTLLLSPVNETSTVFIFDSATTGTFDGAFSRFAY